MMPRVSVSSIISMVIDDMEYHVKDISVWLDKFHRWAFEAELLIGTDESSFVHKECSIDIDNYRAKLPEDFWKLKEISAGDGRAVFNGSDWRYFYKNSPYLANARLTDIAPESNINNSTLGYGQYKFTINGRFIDINMQTGTIGISYTAIPFDDEGCLTISATHRVAVSQYLQYRLIRSLYLSNQISRALYLDMQSEWERRCAQARVNDFETNFNAEVDYASMIWNSHVPVPFKNFR